jgi:hypothetical protein
MVPDAPVGSDTNPQTADAAPTDGGAPDSSTVDASLPACSATAPCAVGYCDDGVCWSTPETAQPYQFSRCDMFTADPPQEVARFVRAQGMIWGAGGHTVVRNDGTHWILSFDPLAATSVSDLLGSTSTVVIVTNAGLYRRDTAGWVQLTPPSASPIASRALVGSRLYVLDTAGALFVHDGTSWGSLTGPTTTGQAQLIAANSTAVYVSTSASELARWDGTAWTAHTLSSSLPTPPPITALATADEQSVFVNGNVHFDGSTFTTTTGGSAHSAAAGHLVGTRVSTGGLGLMAGDGNSIVEWNGTAWTAVTLPAAPMHPTGPNYDVFALPDGYFYRTDFDAIVHDSTGEHQLWVDGPHDVVLDSPLTDVWFDGWDGLLHATGTTPVLVAASAGQVPRNGVRAWSDGSILYAYSGADPNAQTINRFDGTAVTTLIARPSERFRLLRARSPSDFDYVWRMSADHLAIRNAGVDTAVGTCTGDTFRVGLASQRALIAGCRGFSDMLSVFDGTMTSSGTTPAGYFYVWTLGTPPSTSAYLGNSSVGTMAYDGTMWTTATLPAGVYVREAVGPSTTHLVAALADTASGTATHLGWLDATGSWRTTSAYGAAIDGHALDPVITDGTSVVWSTDGSVVTRCRLTP